MRSYVYKAVILLLMFSGQSQADSNSISVFEINSAETYIQAPLEKEIYYFSQTPYLSDLQVRDVQGNNLPFRIMDATTESQNIRREIPAVFFPVAPNTSEETLRNLGNTRIHINAENLQVDIESDRAVDNTGAVPDVDFYLIDMNEFSKSLNKLKIKHMTLGWNYKESNQYQRWEVSGSQDLHHWQNVTSSNLVWLEKEGQSLIQNKIPLDINVKAFNYLQLRCVEFCHGIVISSIKLVEESTEHFYPADTQWAIKGQKSSSQKSIKLRQNDDWKSESAWEFIRSGKAPVNSVSLNLGNQVYGDKIRVLGRSQHKNSWQLVYEGIWFNTKVGNQWFSSGGLNFSRQDFSELRMEFATELKSEFTPELIFHVPSKYVQFIGNQTPPYRLVVSSDTNADAQARILTSLINNQSVNWVNHQWVYLNPEYIETNNPISWKSILFWSLLALAIVLLGWMASKLFKQMNAHQD